MLRKRRTAVVTKRNMLGRRTRRRLSIIEVIRMELLGFTKEEYLDLLDRGYMLPLIAGATTPQNQQAGPAVYFPKNIVVSTDQTINQGDMVYWDDVHFTLKPLTLVSQVAFVAGAGSGGFCGCAAGSSNANVYPNPPAGIPSEATGGIAVQRGGSVYLNSTVGDGSYFPFEPVTVGADSQTITRGGETTADRVGFVIVPAPSSARGAPGATPSPETVAGGSRVEVMLEAKFPGLALL